jgi:secondary thiamine-phosphate synthase enzyme
MQKTIALDSSQKQEMIDVTEKVAAVVASSGFSEGVCHVYCKHTSAAIIINENYDPKICDDIITCLDKVIPAGGWKHDVVDGNADAHIKAAIIGASQTIPVAAGKLVLGRWQAITFFELDGPRSGREIVVTVVGKD